MSINLDPGALSSALLHLSLHHRIHPGLQSRSSLAQISTGHASGQTAVGAQALLLLTSASIKPVRLIGWFAAQAQNMWNIVDRGSRVCLNVQSKQLLVGNSSSMVHNKLQQPQTPGIAYQKLRLETFVLCSLKIASCWAGSNVLKGSQRATLLRMSQPMGRRLSRDPSGCEPPLWVTPPGFTMEYPRELDPDSQSETAPLPSQKCQGCTMARGPAAAKILDAFSLFPFISCHIHSCHFLPSFIIFSHFSPHQGSSLSIDLKAAAVSHAAQ